MIHFNVNRAFEMKNEKILKINFFLNGMLF